MIGKDKTRIVITITDKDKTKLDELAKQENRNISNMVATIIKKYIDENEKSE
jgi:metal-responsive CopG/Arc/MetJ family transcriptional regulator